MSRRSSRGLAVRIALAALVTAGAAVTVLTIGVAVMGADAFAALMMAHGETAEAAQAMFDQSVRGVLVVAVVLAVALAIGLAVVIARMLAHPLEDVGEAARRIADGDYAARVPREGPEEVASLADSFNQMAAALQEQERLRREFIANAAHELRTPLTNLQGYLEALRDGVIQADAATYASLWEETDRLVRLARSLDALAEGEASARPVRRIELDLAPILEASVAFVRPALEARGIAVERRWASPLPARGDPDHLAQVLANLLQNAVRYTPDGGTVTVAAEARSGSVLVSVVNTGEPIPAETRASSSRNSTLVRGTIRSPRRTSKRAGSMVRSACRSGLIAMVAGASIGARRGSWLRRVAASLADPVRRRMARTRAASSAGLKGLDR